MKQFFLSILVRILKFCAQTYIAKTKPYIIWITGSVGKTSCRLIISDTLQKLIPQEHSYTSSKNYNSDIWLSLSILWIENYKPTYFGAFVVLVQWLHRMFFIDNPPTTLLLEYGIDKPGDMDFLLNIATPDCAIFTQLDLVHGQQFPDGKEWIFNEKIKLLISAKDTVFIPLTLEEKCKPLLSNKTIVVFATEEWKGQIPFSDYKISLSETKLTTSFGYMAGTIPLVITTNIVGMHHVSYMCIGMTIAYIISYRKNYPWFWTIPSLHIPIDLQAWRFSLFMSLDGNIIIDSSYNAAPASMRKTISEVLHIQKQFFSDFKVICVLGEMREIGETSIQEHTELGKRLEDKVDVVIWVSGNSVHMTDHLIGLKDPQKHIYWVGTNLEVIDVIKNILWTKNADWNLDTYLIIFKSSQGEIWLEEAIKPFIAKEDRNKLPRQEWYRLKKKQIAKKLFEN